MKKLFSLLIILSLSLPLRAFSDQIFDQIISAVGGDTPKIEVEKLLRKYNGQKIMGRAYFVNISVNVDGDTIVYLSTTHDDSAASAVNIMVFLRRDDTKRTIKKLKPGDFCYLWGTLTEMRMNSVIIHDGMVR